MLKKKKKKSQALTLGAPAGGTPAARAPWPGRKPEAAEVRRVCDVDASRPPAQLSEEPVGPQPCSASWWQARRHRTEGPWGAAQLHGEDSGQLPTPPQPAWPGTVSRQPRQPPAHPLLLAHLSPLPVPQKGAHPGPLCPAHPPSDHAHEEGLMSLLHGNHFILMSRKNARKPPPPKKISVGINNIK